MNELRDKDEQYNELLYKHKKSHSKGGFVKTIIGLILTALIVCIAGIAYIATIGSDSKFSIIIMSFL